MDVFVFLMNFGVTLLLISFKIVRRHRFFNESYGKFHLFRDVICEHKVWWKLTHFRTQISYSIKTEEVNIFAPFSYLLVWHYLLTTHFHIQLFWKITTGFIKLFVGNLPLILLIFLKVNLPLNFLSFFKVNLPLDLLSFLKVNLSLDFEHKIWRKSIFHPKNNKNIGKTQSILNIPRNWFIHYFKSYGRFCVFDEFWNHAFTHFI